MLDFETVLRELTGPEYGFRNEEIAVKVGCSHMSVYRWRNGVQPMKAHRDKVIDLFRREKKKREGKE